MNLQELIRGCEKSDKESQNDLFSLFKDSLMSICLRYSKNTQQANEILKEGFVSIFNTIKNVQHENQLEGWLRKTMIDKAIEVLRRNKQEYKIVSTINAYDGANQDRIIDEVVTRSMESSDVLKAMQALTPAYRVVVNMYLVDGFTLKQISTKLDVGEATIRMNFEKAMYQVRKNIVQLTTVSHGE